MTISHIDHEALFRQVTGREISREDAEELRRLRAHMPGALADSPSYNFDLIIKYHQSQQLRALISRASDVIVGDVQRQSRTAVAKLVDDSVKRIQSAAPSSSDAFFRAVIAACILSVICVTLTATALFGAISSGMMVPPWLSEEAAAKVAWAEAVEARIGPGSVDWTMREGAPDASLVEIFRYLDVRGTGNDPFRQLSEFRTCRAPGTVPYRSRDRSMCRFEVGEDQSGAAHSTPGGVTP